MFSPTLMPQRRVAVIIDADAPAQVTHTVVKAKHIETGTPVRAFVNGEARGSVRTVASKRRIDDGSMVEITWTEDSPLPHVATYKAAYRFQIGA